MSSIKPWTELHEAIEAVRKRAARLRLIDLHVHSPESGEDYRGPEDDAQGFLDSVRAAVPDLEVLGICDHFKCRLACEVAKLAGPSDMLVLPGIELSLKLSEFSPDSVHMVVLFSSDARTEDVYSPVHALGGPAYEAAGTDKPLECKCSELLEVLSGQNAICIAAHVYSDKGGRGWARKFALELVPLSRRRSRLECLDNRTPKEDRELAAIPQELAGVEDNVQRAWLNFLGSSDIVAIEVQSADEVPHYRGDHVRDIGVRPIACILSSDAHSPHEIARPERRTYLRMGGLSLSAVRAALSDPETRVRFVPPQQQARGLIEGIRFTRVAEGTRGFFRDATVAFSENLTCIIGSRGSGKSALIEAIRYALDVRMKGDQPLQDDAQRRREATLGDTRLHLLLSPAQEASIVVTRCLDGEQEAYDAEDGGTPIEISMSASFPVDIYGWSEIEQLGRDTSAQRELLDARADEAAKLDRAIGDAQQALQENRDAIVARARELANLAPQIAELPGLRRKLDVLHTSAFTEAFAARDKADEWKRLVEDITDRFDRAVASLLRPAPDELPTLESDLQHWQESVQNVSSSTDVPLPSALQSGGLGEAIADLAKHVAAATRAAGEVKVILSEAQEQVREALENADSTIEEQLATDFAEDIAERRETTESLLAKVKSRKELKAKLTHLENIEQSRNKEQKELEQLIQSRRTALLPRFVEAQKKLSEFRTRQALSITSRLADLANRAPVSVAVTPSGDRLAFAETLHDPKTDTGYLHRSKIHAFRDRDIAAKLAEHFLPWEFSEAIRNGDVDQIVAVFGADTRGSPEEDARRLIESLHPGPDEDGLCDPEKLDRVLALDEIAVEDKPVIKLDNKPIEQLSPGQRCTALLPIILTQGNWPLIIDQPEDNLDNTMIFHVVVDVLRGLKDKRQVILATHNPNIPVSGDAEQVVVLEARSRTHGYPDADGCIDFPHIIQKVTDIMEGGEEAFKIRAMKYGFDLAENIAHHSRSDQESPRVRRR